MSQTQDTVSAAIKAAQEVAKAVPMTTSTAAAPVPATHSNLPAGHQRSMDDALASAGASVDQWLSVTEDSFKIGKTKFASIVGEIPLGDIRFPYGLRFNVGGSTQFLRSYDGVREARSGKPWAECIQTAQANDPQCKGQYDMAEIVLVTGEAITAEGKVLPAGTRLGITTPVTGFKPFMNWLREIRVNYGPTDDVPVTASVETKSKSGVKDWGIPQFAVLN